MARIQEVTHVEAPVDRVWDLLVDWERQPEWMVDIRGIEVTTPARTGVGVRLHCRTNILGVVVDDNLAVTEWEEPVVLGVAHVGPVLRGVGAFELTPTRYGTRLEWWEEAEVPLGSIGDAVAGVLVVPWVSRVFRRSLSRFKRVCEAR